MPSPSSSSPSRGSFSSSCLPSGVSTAAIDGVTIVLGRYRMRHSPHWQMPCQATAGTIVRLPTLAVDAPGAAHCMAHGGLASGKRSPLPRRISPPHLPGPARLSSPVGHSPRTASPTQRTPQPPSTLSRVAAVQRFAAAVVPNLTVLHVLRFMASFSASLGFIPLLQMLLSIFICGNPNAVSDDRRAGGERDIRVRAITRRPSDESSPRAECLSDCVPRGPNHY